MARQIIDTTTNNGTYIGDPAKVAFNKANDNFSELYGVNAGLYTFISGLQLGWQGVNSILVNAGCCFIQSEGKPVSIAGLVLSGLSLAASTWYHVYVYLNGGVGAAEVSTVSPVSYFGTARRKGADTTRRYTGSIKTNSSAQLVRFYHQPGDSIRFQTDASVSEMMVLSTGQATSATSVSLAAGVPETSTSAILFCTNTSTITARLTLPAYPSENVNGVGAGQRNELGFETDASRNLAYMFGAAPSSGGLFIQVVGYGLRR